MNYYQKSISDYRRDTSHLTLLEHGVYNQLLDTYYLKEVPLTADLDDLMRSHSARTAEEQQAVKNVLKDFFTLSPEGYVHDKCQRVLGRIYEKSEKARASADARWARHRAKQINGLDANASDSDSDGNAEAMLPNNPITHIPNNPLPPAVPAEGDGEVVPKRLKPEAGGTGKRFDEFWAAWPKSERKQDKAKCFAKWKRDNLDLLADTILADIALKRKTQKWQADAGKYIEAPLVYLNGKRWEDGVEPQEQGQGAISGGDWWDTRSGVEKRARELGIFAYGERTVDERGRTITWQLYKNIVIKAAQAAGEKL